jgi:hypothetical protein
MIMATDPLRPVPSPNRYPDVRVRGGPGAGEPGTDPDLRGGSHLAAGRAAEPPRWPRPRGRGSRRTWPTARAAHEARPATRTPSSGSVAAWPTWAGTGTPSKCSPAGSSCTRPTPASTATGATAGSRFVSWTGPSRTWSGPRSWSRGSRRGRARRGPTQYGIPTSTLHSNIWYHLALAHYLRHDFERALPAWRRALEVSTNDDMYVATADWLYMTLRRLGRDAEAAAVLEPIHADMRILENHAYHRRLLMYRGEVEPDELLDRYRRPRPARHLRLRRGQLAPLQRRHRSRPRLFRRILEGPTGPRSGTSPPRPS